MEAIFSTFLGQQRAKQLAAHLDMPLYRNAYALVFSTGMTSGLGFIYWIIAARFYEPDVVGRNSAIITTMVLLATIASFNLSSALIRFIPVAGRYLTRFVASIYGFSLLMASVVSVGFVLIYPRLAPNDNFLGDDPAFYAWFVIATLAWVIFMLQDSALIGLRQSVWVPIENTVFSILKLVLLLAFVLMLPGLGIFASWNIPVLLSLIPVNYLIFRHLIPQQHERAGTTVAVPEKTITWRSLGKYVTVEYVGRLFSLTMSNIMPLIVINLLSNDANAFYNIAWLIAFTPGLLTNSMTQSLTAEGASNPAQLLDFVRRIFRQMLYFIFPMILGMIVLAEPIMYVFGDVYAAEGTPLFRLLAVGMVAASVNILMMGVVRVQQRLRVMLALQVLNNVVTIGLSLFLVQSMGLMGIGLAYAVSETLMLIVITGPMLMRMLRGYATEKRVLSS